MGDLDIAIRYAAVRCAADIAAVPLKDAASARSLRWLESQVVRAERRADKGCLPECPERRKLLHVEWFAEPEADLGWRLYEYQYLLLDQLRQEDEAAAEEARKRRPDAKPTAPKPVSMTSLVVLLSGPEGDTSTAGAHATSAPKEEFAGARWLIDRVYQRTSREIDGWVRERLRAILRTRRKRRGRPSPKDHQRWPNAFFAKLGLFSLVSVPVPAMHSPSG